VTSTLASAAVVLPDGDGFSVGPARVTIDGAHILAVQPGAAPQPGDDDLGDLLLTPAFVDAHTHLALVALRGAAVGAAAAGNMVEDLFFRFESRLTGADVRAFARVGAYECLLHGTGFVADHYYFGRDVAAALAETGLTGMVAPTLQDLAGPGAARTDDAFDDTAALAADAQLAAAGVVAAVGPHATDTVSDDLWRRLHRFAADANLPIHAHVAQSVDEVARIAARSGHTPVGHLRRLGVLDHDAWLLVHLLYTTDADLAALDDRHTLALCPSSQAQFGFPAPVHRWLDAGRRVAIATDCAASNDGMGLPKELRAVAALRVASVARTPLADRFARTGSLADARAVAADRARLWSATTRLGDPTTLLRAVWTVGAHLHPAAKAGVIAPGFLANLAVWDPSHPALWPGLDPLRALAYGDPAPALQQLMTAGRWRTARGHHADLARSAAWADARREASARLAALRA
jgi:5-methylthioadenosine/S-adenosylhomocysteine deaminase